jgi:prophage regulatory protein
MTPDTTTSAEPLLIPVEHVGAILNVSTRTVWRLLSTKRLPEPIRIGGSVRWRLDQVRQWIAAGCPPQQGEK